MSFDFIKCTGTEALSRLKELRSNYPSANKYPFLIGDEEELERLHEAAEFNQSELSQIVVESLNLDLEAWFQERRSNAAEYEFNEIELLGQWPNEFIKHEGITVHRDVLSGALKPTVFIGLADIAEPWMLPAATAYGNWNDCPEASLHCAIMRRWNEQYGAEIVSMSGDVIECHVKRPPATKADAITLAWEQYWYCTDIVEQGVETISNLAATLLNHEYWYFWWD